MDQHNRISTGSGSDRARSFADTEALIAAAQEHFATDFPNPQRVGCPAPGAIRTIVQAERVPKDELQTHLFSCSECFNEYRTVVQAWRAEKERTENATAGWFGPWRNWRILAGATAAALLLLSAGLLFWRASAPQTDQARSQPTPTASVAAESMPKPIGQPEPVGTMPPMPQTTTPQSSANKESLLALNRNLNNYHSLGSQRRGGGEAESPIPLPRAHVRLLLTLPENSPAGSYRVSLFEGRRKRDVVIARSSHGQTLQVILDLRRVVGSQARLSIQRANQPDFAPDEYSLAIKQP